MQPSPNGHAKTYAHRILGIHQAQHTEQQAAHILLRLQRTVDEEEHTDGHQQGTLHILIPVARQFAHRLESIYDLFQKLSGLAIKAYWPGNAAAVG